jgi:hypothetical protein
VAESWAAPAAANLKQPESRCATCLPSSTAALAAAATVIAARFADASFAGTSSGSWSGNSKTQMANSTPFLSSFAMLTATEC